MSESCRSIPQSETSNAIKHRLTYCGEGRFRYAKPGAPVNPWAVCHATTGPKKSAKFERCVQDVKSKHNIKKD